MPRSLVFPGDIVCAHSSGILGELISEEEKHDPCSLPDWRHVFVVTEADGSIINTLERVAVGNIYTDYAKTDLLIGRYTGADPVSAIPAPSSPV